jgi:hypothetical protein
MHFDDDDDVPAMRRCVDAPDTGWTLPIPLQPALDGPVGGGVGAAEPASAAHRRASHARRARSWLSSAI